MKPALVKRPGSSTPPQESEPAKTSTPRRSTRTRLMKPSTIKPSRKQLKRNKEEGTSASEVSEESLTRLPQSREMKLRKMPVRCTSPQESELAKASTSRRSTRLRQPSIIKLSRKKLRRNKEEVTSTSEVSAESLTRLPQSEDGVKAITTPPLNIAETSLGLHPESTGGTDLAITSQPNVKLVKDGGALNQNSSNQGRGNAAFGKSRVPGNMNYLERYIINVKGPQINVLGNQNNIAGNQLNVNQANVSESIPQQPQPPEAMQAKPCHRLGSPMSYSEHLE